MSLMTLFDGTTTVIVEANASFGFKQGFSNLGGSAILRTIDGTGIKQTLWRKLAITISAYGWIPHGLNDLDYDQELTLTIIDQDDTDATKQYTVFGEKPQNNMDVFNAKFEWFQYFEEV